MGFPLTIAWWRAHYREMFNDISRDWDWTEETFARKTTCNTRWYMMPRYFDYYAREESVRRDLFPLPLEYEVASAIEFVTCHILARYYKGDHDYFGYRLGTLFRTRDRAQDGSYVAMLIVGEGEIAFRKVPDVRTYEASSRKIPLH